MLLDLKVENCSVEKMTQLLLLESALFRPGPNDSSCGTGQCRKFTTNSMCTYPYVMKSSNVTEAENNHQQDVPMETERKGKSKNLKYTEIA